MTSTFLLRRAESPRFNVGVLLERDGQRRVLADLVDDARASRGRVALVGGEAGAGKSSVVRDLVDSLRDPSSGIDVRQGACDDLTTPAALGPVIEAVPDVEQIAERAAADRPRLFRRVRALLEATPTLLVLEDVHWADEATLDLVRFLGRRLDGLPLLLVATYRVEETVHAHPLTTLLGDLSTAPGVRRIDIPPLSPAAVRALSTSAGSQLDPDQLFARTGGNAFYVTEVLASPVDELPVTVRDAVLARAARLSDDAQQVLGAAAVLGQPAELPLLVAVSGRTPAAVDECVARGLLTGDGARWDFRHALARRAIADRLRPAQAADLHAAALQTLRGSGDDRRIAFHAERCGDLAAVREHAPRAAERAARLGAHREAAEFYRMALRAQQQRDAAQAELWSRLSYECYLTGRHGEALDARREALELADTPLARGEAERWLSRLSWFLGRNEDSDTYASRAIATLQPLGDTPALAMAYSNQAQLHMLGHDLAPATEWSERALDLARRTGHREAEIHALNNLGTALMLAGDHHEGTTRLRQSLDLALADDAHEHAARAFTNLGSSGTTLRRFTDAERALTSGIAYCVGRDLDSWEQYMRAWHARCLAEQGRYDAAREVVTDLLARPMLPAVVRIPALAVAGQLAMRRGDDTTPTLLGEARDLALETGESQRLTPVAVALAEAAWLDGQVTSIPALVDEAWRVTLARPHPWDLGELSWWLAMAGQRREAPFPAAEPFRLMLDGDWAGAAAHWEVIESPLWVAQCLAQLPDIEASRSALRIVDEIGAPAVRRALVRDRQARGQPVPRQASAAARDMAGLTARELEVLALLVDGLSNADIARALVLSQKTVGHHVSAVLSKLGEPSRSRAAAAALRRGLVASSPKVP